MQGLPLLNGCLTSAPPPLPADAASHVPVCASERRRAGVGARRLHLHVSGGAEQCQRGLGVRHLVGHGAVGPAA